MHFLRVLRILSWMVCALGFGVWLYWAFFVTPVVKPDFVSQGEYVIVDGIQVHFLEKGMGSPVVLLSGFPLNAESYSRLMEYPWKNRRVIALDLPEQGYSEKKGRPLTPDDFALDLKLFLDKLEIPEVDLVGHDLGAGVAMVFAASYPHRVRKLVLLAPPSPNLATDALGPWWHWPWVGEIWSFFFLNEEWYRRWLSQGWTSPYASWQPVVEQYFRPLSTFSGRKGFLAVLRGSSGFSYGFYQERLKTPTLVIRGENDPFCPADAWPGKQGSPPLISSKSLPKVGHFLPEEAPRQIYETIVEFLGEPAEEAAWPAALEKGIAAKAEVALPRPRPRQPALRKKSPVSSLSQGKPLPHVTWVAPQPATLPPPAPVPTNPEAVPAASAAPAPVPPAPLPAGSPAQADSPPSPGDKPQP